MNLLIAKYLDLGPVQRFFLTCWLRENKIRFAQHLPDCLMVRDTDF